MESAPGTVTQVRGVGAGADPLRQEVRRGNHPGRPCHQGRPDRRPARGRAHGRCGAVVRRRRLAAIPHPARGEEPLRPDRRDRRVRDDRRSACAKSPIRPNCSCRNAISAAPAPPCSLGSRARGRCWSRLQALVAPTTLGTPRRAVVGWDPSRLSMVLAVLEAHCGVKLSRPRRLSERRRRPAHPGAGGRSRRGRRAGIVAGQCAAADGRGLFRRDFAVGRGPPGGADLGPAEGSGQTRLRPRRAARIGTRRNRRRCRARPQHRRRINHSGRGNRRARHRRNRTGENRESDLSEKNATPARFRRAGTLAARDVAAPRRYTTRASRTGLRVSGLAGQPLPSRRAAPTSRFAVLNVRADLTSRCR